MIDFIENNKADYGVEPICKILPIAPSTYYRAKALVDNLLRRSRRCQHDVYLLFEITRIWQDSNCCYGARKVWRQLKSEGVQAARCTVERLMRKHQLQGVWRGKGKRTTVSDDKQQRADDLVKRNFTASLLTLAKQCFSGLLILLIFRPIAVGSTPLLLLMSLPVLSSAGRSPAR